MHDPIKDPREATWQLFCNQMHKCRNCGHWHQRGYVCTACEVDDSDIDDLEPKDIA